MISKCTAGCFTIAPSLMHRCRGAGDLHRSHTSPQPAGSTRDPVGEDLVPSVLGEGSEVPLRLPVPPHARKWMLPPPLHLLQGSFVRGVAACNRLLQMPVLCLYDLICGLPVVGEITRPTQLSARHRLHHSHSLSVSSVLLIISDLDYQHE